MIEKLKALWGGRLFNFIGLAIAVVLGVLVDVKTTTPHLAIFLPLAILAFTDLQSVFGVFNPGMLGPKVRELVIGAIGAVATYVTSDTTVSGWRYAPLFAAILFSARTVLGGAPAAAQAGRVVGILALVFLGFNASGCAAAIASLPVIIADAQDAALVLNTIAEIVNALNLDPATATKVHQAIALALTADDAVTKLAQGGQDVNQAQLDAAFQNFEGAFTDVMTLVAPLGITTGNVPKATRTASGWVVPTPDILLKVRRS
jgi:hypothetical protein